MKDSTTQRQRLISIFILALLLCTFPIVGVFNHATLVAGIPLLYIYLFGVWFLLVLMYYLAIQHNK